MNADIAATKTVDLLALIGKTTSLKKTSAHQWQGPCPRCGGRDRFVVDPTRGWFCRQCYDGHWSDALDFVMWLDGLDYQRGILRLLGASNITPDELERRAEQRRQAEEKRKAQEQVDQERARVELAEGKPWEQYNRNLTTYQAGLDLWHARGLTDDWIKYYGVGYSPDRSFGDFSCASLTIPYWRTDNNFAWHCIGLRHRLLDDNAPGGKYRPHLPGLGNHLYYTDPMTRRIFGDVLIVEGEIKAMVTWAALWCPDTHELLTPNLWVIGIPGKSWKAEYLDELKDADRVFVCLDPDAGKDARRMVEELNGRGKLIELPGKIDDLILAGALDTNALITMVR